jgi:hypothetical protein
VHKAKFKNEKNESVAIKFFQLKTINTFRKEKFLRDLFTEIKIQFLIKDEKFVKIFGWSFFIVDGNNSEKFFLLGIVLNFIFLFFYFILFFYYNKI